MPKYTLRLENLVDMEMEKKGWHPDNYSMVEKMKIAIPLIFDFDYGAIPELKAEFERRFILHYWMDEIGQETPALWKYYLMRELSDAIYLINQRWLSTLLEYDPLSNTKTSTEYFKDGKTTGKDDRLTRERGAKDSTLKKGKRDRGKKTTQSVEAGVGYKDYELDKDTTDTTVFDENKTTNEVGNKKTDGTDVTDGTITEDNLNTEAHTGTVKENKKTDNTETTDDLITNDLTKDVKTRNTFYDTPQDEITAHAYDAGGGQIYTTYTDSQGNTSQAPVNRDYATDLRLIHEVTRDTGTVKDDKTVVDNGNEDKTTTYGDTITTNTDKTKKENTTVTHHENVDSTNDTEQKTHSDTKRTINEKDVYNENTADAGVENTLVKECADSKAVDHLDEGTASDGVLKKKTEDLFYENYIQTRYGNNGSYSFPRLLTEFRSAMIDVADELVEKMRVCFMFVY